MKKLKQNFIEVLSSVIPMMVLILVISFLAAPMTGELMLAFLGGGAMMIAGMTLFLFGADISMMEVGSQIGSFFIKKRNLALLLGISFLIGIVVTIAEPDVQVLAAQVAEVSAGAVSKTILTAVVGVGVGIFLAIAAARIAFQIKLTTILFIGYIAAFILAAFANPEFAPLAFDSGGVTTGPMTVPFLLSFGTGITSAIRSGKGGNDSFGIVGLVSLGPILAVMILGVIFR